MKSRYYIEKIDTNQRRINLNESWRFALGDIPGFTRTSSTILPGII